MAGELSLKTPLTGLVTLVPTNTATDKTITLPATTGTMVVQDGTNTTTVTNLSASSITDSGNLTFTGTGNRITGDFSNATIANRVLLQSSTSNGQTSVGLIPNGTSTQTQLIAFNSTDPANSSYIQTLVSATEARINSGQLGTGTNLPMTFYTGGSEAMRIVSGGNVGIGTTSPQAKLAVSNGGAAGLEFFVNYPGGGVGTYIQSYNRSSPGYVNTAYDAADHSFRISGTEKMFLNSSGNLGIGTGSPNQRLQVTGSNGTGFAGATLQNSNANVGLAGVQFSSDTTYSKSAIAQVRESPNGVGPLVFYVDSATDAADWAAGDEKMRISAAGNVGIGTTTTTYKTNIVYTNSAGGVAETGLYLRNTSTGNSTQMLFDGHRSYSLLVQGSFGAPAGGFTIQDNTAGVDRLNIDSSGNVLVGQTSWSFSNNGTQIAANGRIYNTSNTDYNFELAGSTTARMRFYSSAGGSGTTVGTITVSGSATTYATSSDYRLKENVQPMQGALATVAALKPVTYKWKTDGSDGQGFIAHELQAVVPDAVTGEKDAVDKDGKPQYQGVDTSFLVATLTAAIQELTARLEVLENK